MKKVKLILAAAGLYLVGMFFTSAVYKSAGSHPGSTGAPKELTCARAGCHDDKSPSPGEGINSFKFSNSSNQYKKGSIYDIWLRVTKPGLLRSGFEVVALDTLNNMVGTWKIIDAKRTQITKVDTLKRFYVTHKLAGTPSSGDTYNEWVFAWTAPSNYEGDITFYYATNVCNSDGKRFGDNTYLSKHVIKAESASTAVKGININQFSFYPNPAKGTVSVVFKSPILNSNKLILKDLTGKILKETINVVPDQNASYNWDIHEIPAGIYFVEFNSGEQIWVEKIILK